jgi:hypothetical protein
MNGTGSLKIHLSVLSRTNRGAFRKYDCIIDEWILLVPNNGISVENHEASYKNSNASMIQIKALRYTMNQASMQHQAKMYELRRLFFSKTTQRVIVLSLKGKQPKKFTKLYGYHR